MTLGYHFLFSNWIEKNGTEDNNNDLSDSGKPNLNSRFRGPTLGVHLTMKWTPEFGPEVKLDFAVDRWV